MVAASPGNGAAGGANLLAIFDSLGGILGRVGGGGGSSASSAASNTVSVSPNIFAVTGGAGGNPSAGGGVGASTSASAATSQTPAGQTYTPTGARYDVDDPPLGTVTGNGGAGGDMTMWLLIGGAVVLFLLMDGKK